MTSEFRLVFWFLGSPCGGIEPFEVYRYADTREAAAQLVAKMKLVDGYAGHEVTKITYEPVEQEGAKNLCAAWLLRERAKRERGS